MYAILVLKNYGASGLRFRPFWGEVSRNTPKMLFILSKYGNENRYPKDAYAYRMFDSKHVCLDALKGMNEACGVYAAEAAEDSAKNARDIADEKVAAHVSDWPPTP